MTFILVFALGMLTTVFIYQNKSIKFFLKRVYHLNPVARYKMHREVHNVLVKQRESSKEG